MRSLIASSSFLFFLSSSCPDLFLPFASLSFLSWLSFVLLLSSALFPSFFSFLIAFQAFGLSFRSGLLCPLGRILSPTHVDSPSSSSFSASSLSASSSSSSNSSTSSSWFSRSVSSFFSDQRARILDRFFLGGASSLRGFDEMESDPAMDV